MTTEIKSRTVKFSFGLVKDAELKVPAEAFSLFDVAKLIRASYIAWRFRTTEGSSVMFSDEVAVSCIGKSDFFAGALGGYESRLSAEKFASLKLLCDDDVAIAVGVVLHRNPNLSRKAAYEQAAKNEALSDADRNLIKFMIPHITE